MTNLLQVWSSVDPRDLRINKKFRNNPHLPPGVSRAQDNLILDIKQAIPDDYDPCQVDCGATLTFVFPDKRTDIDGPIKRTLDAIEKAIKAKGYKWHDGKIDHLAVRRVKTDPRTHPDPGIGIVMF